MSSSWQHKTKIMGGGGGFSFPLFLLSLFSMSFKKNVYFHVLFMLAVSFVSFSIPSFCRFYYEACTFCTQSARLGPEMQNYAFYPFPVFGMASLNRLPFGTNCLLDNNVSLPAPAPEPRLVAAQEKDTALRRQGTHYGMLLPFSRKLQDVGHHFQTWIAGLVKMFR